MLGASGLVVNILIDHCVCWVCLWMLVLVY